MYSLLLLVSIFCWSVVHTVLTGHPELPETWVEVQLVHDDLSVPDFDQGAVQVPAPAEDNRTRLGEALMRMTIYCNEDLFDPVQVADGYLHEGADVDYYSTTWGKTALHAAIELGKTKNCGIVIAHLLVDRGARVDIPDGNHLTVMQLLEEWRSDRSVWNDQLAVLYQRLTIQR